MNATSSLNLSIPNILGSRPKKNVILIDLGIHICERTLNVSTRQSLGFFLLCDNFKIFVILLVWVVLYSQTQIAIVPSKTTLQAIVAKKNFSRIIDLEQEGP